METFVVVDGMAGHLLGLCHQPRQIHVDRLHKPATGRACFALARPQALPRQICRGDFDRVDVKISLDQHGFAEVGGVRAGIPLAAAGDHGVENVVEDRHPAASPGNRWWLPRIGKAVSIIPT